MSGKFCKLTCVLFAIAVFMSIVFCSGPQYGGGVETTNGITIAVKENQIQGTAPAGSQIVLCDTSYVPYMSFQPLTAMFIDTAFANEYGKFKLDLIPDGFYNLIGRSCNSDSGAIIANICINRLNTTEVLKSSDYVMLASITGKVFIDSEGTESVLVYLIGTGLGSTTDSSGMYTIGNVPVGIYKLMGSYINSLKEPGIVENYSSRIDNIAITGNVQSIRIDLNLEKED
jgi:hypothetical protein